MDHGNPRQSDRALTFLRERGMARLHELVAAGIHAETVSRLTRAGEIVRLTRGLYQLPDADFEAGHSFAEAAKRVPKGVVCLVSALQFHRLTLQLPSSIWMAIERTTRRPKVDDPHVRFVRFGDLALGVDTHVIEGVDVRVCSPARTVVDCFRYRNKIGTDIALEGLREAVHQRKALPDDITRIARCCRARTVIKPYLESVLADRG